MAVFRHLETALKRERALVAGELAALVLVSSIYTAAGVGMEMSAASMTFGDIDGMAMVLTMAMPAAGAWNAAKFVMMFLMWWLMMIAMMLPSAAPAVLLYASF